MKILNTTHHSQLKSHTKLNSYTSEISNEFPYVGISTKTSKDEVQEKSGKTSFAMSKLRPIFNSKISDAKKIFF